MKITDQQRPSADGRGWAGSAAALLAIALAGFTDACGGAMTNGASDGGPGHGGGPEAGVDAATGTPADRCAQIGKSISEAGFDAKVTMHCDDQYAYLISDTYPDHPKMTGITGTNDQVPVPAPGYSSPIVLAPVHANTVTSIDAAVGVAVNGVPIYDYTSQGMKHPAVYDPRVDTKATGELDLCNGHAGRGDDYHYHALPTCMVAAMKNKGPAAILGWGFDGYPIYGNENPDGTPIGAGELDICNAKRDPTYGYRYHTSDTHPYIIQCLVGTFDLTKAPRVPPLDKLGGGMGRPPGAKPPGGVTNLTLVEAGDGTRTMTYTWMTKMYSISYKPSSTAKCWDYADQSFTTGGVLQKNTYCRNMP